MKKYIIRQYDADDAVIAQAVLEHVKNPQKIIGELKMVLRPGAIFMWKYPFFNPFMPIRTTFKDMRFPALINSVAHLTGLKAGLPAVPVQQLLGY